MNYADMENLWAGQAPAMPSETEIAAAKRRVESELRRRSRMLAYEVGMNAFGLIVLPLLAVANYRHDPSRYAGPWQLAHVAFQLLVVATWVVYSTRRLLRHRALSRRAAASIRALTELSVASLEAEMKDLRFWQQPVLWLTAASLVAALGSAVFHHGWRTMALPGALTLGLVTGMALVFRRHYRVNLRPAYERQRELLRQFR